MDWARSRRDKVAQAAAFAYLQPGSPRPQRGPRLGLHCGVMSCQVLMSASLALRLRYHGVLPSAGPVRFEGFDQRRRAAWQVRPYQSAPMLSPP
jgi:hypothetical protein